MILNHVESEGKERMNNIQVFNNSEFGSIRTVEINKEPFFVAKDVAEILGYRDTSDAIKRHVDEDDKLTRCFTDSGQNREMYIINESGLYSLVLSSKLPTAKRFKRWVTSEVLPAIRKTGGYIGGAENMSEAEIMARAVLIGQRTIEEQKRKIENLKNEIDVNRPKVLFADAVSASHTSILVGELAKILRGNGCNIGQNRLFERLRNDGYLMKCGTSKNIPTQRAMEMGLFEIKEGSYINGNGVNVITKTTKVTGKGQTFFVNKFLREQGGINGNVHG